MKTYFLPKELKPCLRKIWGIPIFGKSNEVEKRFKDLILRKKFSKIITVGDYCSLALPSDVKIFDGKIKRKKIRKFPKYSYHLSNPAGTIRKEVWPVLKRAIKENKNIFVDGEEDLLVIPAVLISKKNMAVVYGFPGKGVCLIELSLQVKKNLKKLLKKFKTN